jgi:hypothetical protein
MRRPLLRLILDGFLICCKSFILICPAKIRFAYNKTGRK